MTDAVPQSPPHGRHQTVLILDFGSQFTQLIARRVRENRVYCEVHPFDLPLDEIRRRQPAGLILSGGPQSVYEADSPHANPALLDLGIPVLGICYGMQWITHHLGDGVQGGSSGREYGRAEVEVVEPGRLLEGLSSCETVWMSHGDSIRDLPPGFRLLARTGSGPVVAFENPERGIYGVQPATSKRKFFRIAPPASLCVTSGWNWMQ